MEFIEERVGYGDQKRDKSRKNEKMLVKGIDFQS